MAVTTLTVTPVNDVPTVVTTGASSVNESKTLHTYTFDTMDPDSVTFSAGTQTAATATVGPINFGDRHR